MVLGILITFCIILFIICFVELILIEDKDFGTACIVFLVVSLFFGFFQYEGYYGKSTSNPEYVEEVVIKRNELIAEIDEDNLTSEMLIKIKNYNSNLNEFNNLWVRWEKEDNSEYELDYDYYYNLFMEQQKEKMEGK